MEATEVQQEQQPQEWEQAKENMAPLRTGRTRTALVEATNSTSQLALEHERRQLLQAIDVYKGEDPLEPWLRLIKWTQEHLVACGKVELQKVLHSCTTRLANNPRYAADKRFLRVWVHYADCLPDPSDVFLFLKDKGIGLDHALYYEAYATYFELKGNCPAAEAVYSDGIQRLAQPVERLKQKYAGFQSRMAQRIQRRIQEEASGAHVAGTTDMQVTSAGARTSLAPLVPVAPRSSLLTQAAGAAAPGRPMLGLGQGRGTAQGPALLGVSHLPTQQARQPSNPFLLPHQQQQQQAGSFQPGLLSGLVAASARQGTGVGGQAHARPVAIATDEEFKQDGMAASSMPGYASLPQGASHLKTLKPYGVMRKENQETPAIWAGSTLPQAAAGAYAPAPAPRLDICVDDEFQDDGSSGPSGSGAVAASSGTAQVPGGPGTLTLSSLLQAKSSAASVPSVLAGPGAGGAVSQSLLGGAGKAGAAIQVQAVGSSAGRPSVSSLIGAPAQGTLGLLAHQQAGVVATAAARQQGTLQPGPATSLQLQQTTASHRSVSLPVAAPQAVGAGHAPKLQEQQQAKGLATGATQQQHQPGASGLQGAHAVSPGVAVEELSLEELRARAWWKQHHAPAQPSSTPASRQELTWEQWWKQQLQVQQQQQTQVQVQQHQQHQPPPQQQQQLQRVTSGSLQQASGALLSKQHTLQAPSAASGSQPPAAQATRISPAMAPSKNNTQSAALQAHEEAQQLNQTDCFMAPELCMAPPARPEPTITIATRAAFDALNDMFGSCPPPQSCMPPPQNVQSASGSQAQYGSQVAPAAACQQPAVAAPAGVVQQPRRKPLGMLASEPVGAAPAGAASTGAAATMKQPNAVMGPSDRLGSTVVRDQAVESRLRCEASGQQGKGSDHTGTHLHSSGSDGRGYVEPTLTINTKAAFDALNEMWCDALPHESQRRAGRSASDEQQMQAPGSCSPEDEQVTRMPSLPASMKHITSMDVLRLANKGNGARPQPLAHATSAPTPSPVLPTTSNHVAPASMPAALPAQSSLQIHEDTELFPPGAGHGRRRRRSSSMAYPGLGPAAAHQQQSLQPAASSLAIFEDTVCMQGGLAAAVQAASHTAGGLQMYEDTEFIAGGAAASKCQRNQNGWRPQG